MDLGIPKINKTVSRENVRQALILLGIDPDVDVANAAIGRAFVKVEINLPAFGILTYSMKIGS